MLVEVEQWSSDGLDLGQGRISHAVMVFIAHTHSVKLSYCQAPLFDVMDVFSLMCFLPEIMVQNWVSSFF